MWTDEMAYAMGILRVLENQRSLRRLFAAEISSANHYEVRETDVDAAIALIRRRLDGSDTNDRLASVERQVAAIHEALVAPKV